jgi:hypothetical protein
VSRPRLDAGAWAGFIFVALLLGGAGVICAIVALFYRAVFGGS